MMGWDQSSTGVDIHQWVDNVKLTVWWTAV